MPHPKSRRVRKVRVTHHLEEWVAEVGRELRGRDRKGNILSSRATVLEIDAENLILYTDGRDLGTWHDRAQVDGMSDVEYFQDDLTDDPATEAPGSSPE